MRRYASALALTLLAGCAATPGAPAPLTPPAALPSGDAPPPEVLAAAVARVRLRNTGFLFPTPRPGAPWNYGVLDEDRPTARRVPGGWRIAFPFACPPRPDLARVVFVSDDHQTAELDWPAVRLPGLHPVEPPLQTQGFLHLAAATPPLDRPDAIGYWRAAPADYPLDLQLAPDTIGPGPGAVFVYDGHDLIVPILAEHAWEWAPEDLLFRLTARWDEADVLWARFPSGEWRPFARFRDRRFEAGTTAAGAPLPMRRIDLAEDRALEQKLLRPRPPHDYAIPINAGPIALRCDAEGHCASSLRSASGYLCDWWAAHRGR